MTVESVRAFFAAHAPEIKIIELADSTATVELAAKGHGVQPAQIAKTLSLRIKDRTMLVVTSGTARLNNRKIKDVLGGKPRMLSADEVVAMTGHPVGGVCPFGLATPAAGLLRRVAEGVRRGRSGGRLDQQCPSDCASAHGRAGQGRMGRCLRQRRLRNATPKQSRIVDAHCWREASTRLTSGDQGRTR